MPRELYNKGKVAAAHASQAQEQGQEGAANAADGGQHQKWNPKGGHKGTTFQKKTPYPKGSGTQGQKKESFFICFCCFEFGHGCDQCPKREQGWKITKEIRAKALALKNEKIERLGKANMAQGEHAPNTL